MGYARSNLLTRGMRGDAKTISGISFAWDGDWYHVSGTATGDIGWRAYRSSQIPVVAGKQYTLSIEFADGVPDADSYNSSSFQLFSDFSKNTYKTVLGMNRNEHVAFSVDQSTLDAYHVGFQIWGPIIKGGATVDLRVRWMLVEGDTPAAWAPAEGETLAGGGALMSANLWKAENVTPAGIPEDGIYACSGTRGVRTNVALDRLAENQTFHCGFSVNPGAGDTFNLTLCYKDAAGSVNYAAIPDASVPAGKWTRVSGSVVVPSGMTVYQMVICNNRNASGTSGWKVTNPTLSLGSPVTLASSAHTPYATQDHLRSEYATKAALKVTSDAVTAEVEERGRLAGRVGTLEGTTGTHTSKLQQLAASITSLVRGESTYTDPDGKSATSGIYSLVTQTRDSVTALFGSYTKTEDLASTQAVKDAKKAGTDAQAAASAAQSTADSLATMIREDATGITVGKSADGETWSTGRTRMTADAYQILDKAGTVITQMANDGASFLSGLVRIVVGTGTLPGNKTANFIRVDVGSGVVGLSGIISRLDAAINGFTSSVSAGWEQDFGYGVTAIVRESETVSSAAHLASDKAELHVGDNHMTMTGGGYDLSQPEYLTAALLGTGGGGTGVTHSQDAVTMTPDLDTCGPGVFSYNASTAARPTDYGTCVCIRAGDGTTSTWLFQLALPTVGDPLWRRNINGAGWSSWWTITSQ